MNPLVGNMGVSGAIYLGFNKLYLFGLDNGKKIESYDVINSLGHDALSYLESINATEAIQKYEEAGLIGTSGDIRYLNMPELYSAFLSLKESEEYKDINFADAAAQGLLYDSGVN